MAIKLGKIVYLLFLSYYKLIANTLNDILEYSEFLHQYHLFYLFFLI